MKEKVVVIGLGVSGKAAAHFLLSKGYEVWGYDEKLSDLCKNEQSTLTALLDKGLQVLRKGASLSNRIKFIVISPGIAYSHPLLKQAQELGIEIIGEAELALRYMKQKAVAITGTNGKTTVTLLVEHVLKASGKKAKAVGNIGLALTEYVAESDPDEIAVVELSSYQLETLQTPAFIGGVLLNITPDHLDRYGSLEEYAKAKIALYKVIKPLGSFFVYEEVCKEYGFLLPSSFTLFGKENTDWLPVSLKGHDLINAQAAYLLCSLLGVSQDEFIRAFNTFTKPSHRIEFVREFLGIKYYDDSKGTNIDAVLKAVSVMDGQVVLIAGGVDKGASYLPWKDPFLGKVKAMILIGKAAAKIKEELGLFFNVKIVDSLDDAVQTASEIASPGENVLLSPGCSSFDMFRDYAERGKEFQRCVGLLEERRRV